MTITTVLDICIRGLLGAGFASLGFAILFNIRGRSLFYAALSGGIGGLVYNFTGQILGLNDVLANFCGSLALTICAEIFSRYLKVTMTTFLACALIPLVPGGGAYRMMVAFIGGNIAKGLELGLKTISISGMLALGILVVSAFTRLYYFSKQHMKRLTVKSVSKG